MSLDLSLAAMAPCAAASRGSTWRRLLLSCGPNTTQSPSQISIIIFSGDGVSERRGVAWRLRTLVREASAAAASKQVRTCRVRRWGQPNTVWIGLFDGLAQQPLGCLQVTAELDNLLSKLMYNMHDGACADGEHDHLLSLQRQASHRLTKRKKKLTCGALASVRGRQEYLSPYENTLNPSTCVFYGILVAKNCNGTLQNRWIVMVFFHTLKIAMVWIKKP